MLQKKIYEATTPFNFDKLFQQERFFVFPDIEAYLAFKKERGSMQSDEFAREIILVSSPSLRLGDSAYWLHHLNKHHAGTSFLLLTDSHL